LTKRSSEDLTEYMSGLQIRVRYLHSEIKSFERVKILRDLRLGEFDVLVGINLLREGLDLPEVSLVAVLDADKQGFLRSKGALLQMAGRAARHKDGLVILYGDKRSEAMEYLISETKQRRKKQEIFNIKHHITPKTIYKNMDDIIHSTAVADSMGETIIEEKSNRRIEPFSQMDKQLALDMMRQEMLESAEKLEFEQAAKLRDEIEKLEKELEKVF
jgi:excinuclease ABC subunit B